MKMNNVARYDDQEFRRSGNHRYEYAVIVSFRSDDYRTECFWASTIELATRRANSIRNLAHRFQSGETVRGLWDREYHMAIDSVTVVPVAHEWVHG